jgi:hypothetical protein
MHPDEPSMEELNKMYRELMTNKSSDANDIKKLYAIDKQIQRREAESKLQKKVEKPVEKIVEKNLDK